jgi:cysteine sulfinate desulfinase/cysteine desulfurase-like protein
MAMGVDPGLAVGSVRISMGRDTTETDIEDVLQALTDVVQQLETFPTAED